MAYGYSPGDNDPLVRLVDSIIGVIGISMRPSGHIVDILPFFKHLPRFKRLAKHGSHLVETAAQIPYAFVRRQMTAGSHGGSYVSHLIDVASGPEQELSPADENCIKWTAATMYLAGVESTAGTLTSFLLAMIMFPDIQRKCQQEIDRVVGTGRLPTFEDRDNLPYVDAMLKELLRWNPIAPFGLSHIASEDIIYDGYTIPKGSVLVATVWSMCHDSSVYEDPTVFNPARFLGPEKEADPWDIVFGFGRRLCPGRFFADASLFLDIVTILSLFNVNKGVDELGNELEPELHVRPGIINHTMPFPHKVTPRSSTHAALIRRLEGDVSWNSSDASLLGEIPSFDI
ncbi:hypothetical protein CDD80_3123 [Ophiocordyceps camponoti-rufipedis]|uniref:Cytochrome P450 n=1 Tax=Ophiocordyceps camponoti-rufipedis TaxID=2004952 RepID=A0A2C5Z3T5_9HYPO|nr:hypothetical protein CDD80_3123 [Ophiocordyceps camponoti-rufipedis]